MLPSRSTSEWPSRSNRPSHYNVKAALAGVLKHLIYAEAVFAPLGPANARVAVFLDNFPAAAFGNLSQLTDLVFHRLFVGRDSHVNCGPFPREALPLPI